MRELIDRHQEGFLVRSFETDARQKLRLTTLFQYLQEVAGRHVADTTLGYGALKERGQFWVLVRIRARIHRMPAWRDQVLVETWAKHMDRMFAFREFELKVGDELLVSATSEWMLMDRETRKPCRLSTLPARMPIRQLDALEQRLAKIVPEGRRIQSRVRAVRFSDIDMYRHVNNTKYIEWALDSFDYGFLLDHEPEELQVNFVAEVGPDEMVDVALYDSGGGAGEQPGLYYIEGFNTTKQMKAFQMEIRLR